MLKAVNTAANRVGFSLVITLNEKQISDCIILLEKEYSVRVGYARNVVVAGKECQSLQVKATKLLANKDTDTNDTEGELNHQSVEED